MNEIIDIKIFGLNKTFKFKTPKPNDGDITSFKTGDQIMFNERVNDPNQFVPGKIYDVIDVEPNGWVKVQITRSRQNGYHPKSGYFYKVVIIE